MWVTKEKGSGCQRSGKVVTKKRGCGDKKRVVTREDVVTKERGYG